MRFLKLLFWLFLALLAALFIGRNWTDVTIDLWGNVAADIKLPLLLLAAALVGYLPTSIRWRLKSRRLLRQHRSAPPPIASPPPAFEEPLP